MTGGTIAPSYIEEYTAKGSPTLPLTVSDSNGPVDLTGAAITGYLLSLVDGSVIKLRGTFAIPNQTTNNGEFKGQFTYQMTLIDVNSPGTWQAFFSAKLPSEPYTREFSPALFVVLPTPEWINNMTIQETDLNINGAPNSSTNPAFVALVSSIVVHTIVDQLPSLVLAASSANIGRVTPQVAGSDVTTSNPVPITAGQVGLVAPKTGAEGNAANTTGGQEYLFKWQGDVTVQRVIVSNETGADIRYELDTTASANSLRLKDGNVLFIAQPCTVLHLFTVANQNINQAAGIMVRGYN